MRTLLVVPQSYHEEDSRRADRARSIVAGATTRGHELEVATNKWWDQHTAIHHDRWTTHHAIGRSGRSTSGFARVLRRYDPDVIHLVDTPATSVLTAALAADAPVVYEANGFDSPLVQHRRFRQLDHRIASIVVPTEVVHTALLEAGVDRQIHRIPDPIDLDLIRSVTPADSTDIVWSARSLDRAYLEDLLLALAERRHRAWTATLLVGEAEVDRARTAAESYDLGGHVVVRAGVTRRERLAMYRGATTFVHTADDCAFATELLWAMAAGCVGLVHMRPRSSAHELVQKHDRGIRVSSPEELVDGLDQATQLETATIDPTFAPFDIDHIVDRLTGVYRSVLNPTG